MSLLPTFADAVGDTAENRRVAEIALRMGRRAVTGRSINGGVTNAHFSDEYADLMRGHLISVITKNLIEGKS
jgi:ribosomal protein S2